MPVLYQGSDKKKREEGGQPATNTQVLGGGARSDLGQSSSSGVQKTPGGQGTKSGSFTNLQAYIKGAEGSNFGKEVEGKVRGAQQAGGAALAGEHAAYKKKAKEGATYWAGPGDSAPKSTKGIGTYGPNDMPGNLNDIALERKAEPSRYDPNLGDRHSVGGKNYDTSISEDPTYGEDYVTSALEDPTNVDIDEWNKYFNPSYDVGQYQHNPSSKSGKAYQRGLDYSDMYLDQSKRGALMNDMFARPEGYTQGQQQLDALLSGQGNFAGIGETAAQQRADQEAFTALDPEDETKMGGAQLAWKAGKDATDETRRKTREAIGVDEAGNMLVDDPSTPDIDESEGGAFGALNKGITGGYNTAVEHQEKMGKVYEGLQSGDITPEQAISMGFDPEAANMFKGAGGMNTYGVNWQDYFDQGSGIPNRAQTMTPEQYEQLQALNRLSGGAFESALPGDPSQVGGYKGSGFRRGDFMSDVATNKGLYDTGMGEDYEYSDVNQAYDNYLKRYQSTANILAARGESYYDENGNISAAGMEMDAARNADPENWWWKNAGTTTSSGFDDLLNPGETPWQDNQDRAWTSYYDSVRDQGSTAKKARKKRLGGYDFLR